MSELGSAYALSLSEVTKSFGKAHIIRGVDLNVMPEEIHAVIGPNGAGKSTLFNLISGRFAPTSGDIRLFGQQIHGCTAQSLVHKGLARSFQITKLFPSLTVHRNAEVACIATLPLHRALFRTVSNDQEVQSRVGRLLAQVQLTRFADELAGSLSYAQQRALEVALTLASAPRVLLLDEPMAGMSADEARHTSELIRSIRSGLTVLMIEHDMDVVFSLADRVTVLVNGSVLATGTPNEIREHPAVLEAYLGTVVA